MEKFEYKERYSHPYNICLNLTDDCNLACRYCFVQQKPNYMTLNIAKQAIEWGMDNLNWHREHNTCHSDNRVFITYFGGEPTLMWDEIIVPLTEWAYEKYSKKDIGFTITTNGTLLNEEKVKFLYKNNIIPLLSIDGAPQTQDYNRPCKNPNLKSSDLQYKNIPYILKYFPNTCFRATIDENTVANTFENYIFAQYMGFKNIFMMPNCRSIWKQENLEILNQQFGDIYAYLIWYFEHEQMPPMIFEPINNSFKHLKKYNINILNKKDEIPDIMRCGLGTSGCAIGYNGEIYACQEQNSKEQNSYFLIGDLNNGINFNKHNIFLNQYYNSSIGCGDKIEYCNNCLLKNICRELHCPSSCHDMFNDFGKDTYVHCYWLRLMCEYAINTLNYLQDNTTFKRYLKEQCQYDFLKEED